MTEVAASAWLRIVGNSRLFTARLNTLDLYWESNIYDGETDIKGSEIESLSVTA